jgi:hypothetical protein
LETEVETEHKKRGNPISLESPLQSNSPWILNIQPGHYQYRQAHNFLNAVFPFDHRGGIFGKPADMVYLANDI